MSILAPPGSNFYNAVRKSSVNVRKAVPDTDNAIVEEDKDSGSESDEKSDETSSEDSGSDSSIGVDANGEETTEEALYAKV